MTPTGPGIAIDLPDETATAALAADLASALRAGDVVALHGDLGAGKTTLARALIRALADDPELEVPSPTFTLVQTYEDGWLPVAHLDLYRLSGPEEIDELGLEASALDGIVLVEWPERAGDRLPAERLDLTLEMAGSGRRAMLRGATGVLDRIERARAARLFLQKSGWDDAALAAITGDASSRRYDRVRKSGRSAVLMDWPRQGQLLSGDPRATFRARDARAFVAVARALRAAGISAPEVLAADVEQGFLLLEDFGEEGIAADGVPDAGRYRVAMEMLAALHAEPRAPVLVASGQDDHGLPRLTGDALLAELTLFADAYAPHVRGAPLESAARDELFAIWRGFDAVLQRSEQSWVLFDVQSPNLFWLPQRRGIARIGVIDFQDMFFGPTAYDVASLAQDARVTVPPALEAELVGHYVAMRKNADPAFDALGFETARAIAGVLRQSKNLGAFAWLVASGKQNYINHIPRLSAYLARSLSHPVLSPLAVWYEKHLIPEIQAPS